MDKHVIIVAGGKGNRFNSELPKQFVLLGDKPILMHTIIAFYNYSTSIEITLVLPKEQIEYWKQLCEEYKFSFNHNVVEGGKERFYSVKNGLANIKNECLVAIHDGVRPLIDAQTIENSFAMAEKKGNAIPVVKLVDSMRMIDDANNKHVDRDNFRLIQTPQVFKSEIILEAYQQEFSSFFTDDASVVEALYPNTINLVEGNRQNIKITTPEDLIYAEAILKSDN